MLSSIGCCHGDARRDFREGTVFYCNHCPSPAFDSRVSGIKGCPGKIIRFFHGTAPYKNSKIFKYLKKDILQGKVVFKRGCAAIYYRDIQSIYSGQARSVEDYREDSKSCCNWNSWTA